LDISRGERLRKKEEADLKKSRKMVLLLLPFLLAYIVQATQYARAPVKYGYYVVYAKNADIALLPGTDLSPEDGDYLLRNATTQQGLYNLSLGEWGPGYHVNYTDAFHIKNQEAFRIRMIGLNFSSPSNGTEYLALYMKNDTNGDGSPDGDWIAVWLGSQTWPPANGDQLSATNYMYFGDNTGGELPVKIEIMIPETGVPIGPSQPSILCTGTMYLWFTSAEF